MRQEGILGSQQDSAGKQPHPTQTVHFCIFRCIKKVMMDGKHILRYHGIYGNPIFPLYVSYHTYRLIHRDVDCQLELLSTEYNEIWTGVEARCRAVLLPLQYH